MQNADSNRTRKNTAICKNGILSRMENIAAFKSETEWTDLIYGDWLPRITKKAPGYVFLKTQA